jgi:hypothetical protein
MLTYIVVCVREPLEQIEKPFCKIVAKTPESKQQTAAFTGANIRKLFVMHFHAASCVIIAPSFITPLPFLAVFDGRSPFVLCTEQEYDGINCWLHISPLKISGFKLP